MKSKTSLFNPVVFKKNLIRFAPAWVLFTVVLFLYQLPVLEREGDYYRAINVSNNLPAVTCILALYAVLLGQLLFGDLLNSRMCNALHAMPLRRECWYVTHLLSGFAFALVPLTLVALLMTTQVGAAWSAPLWWLLASFLQFVFFFGAAVLSVFLSGNRIGMLASYTIVNFLSIIFMLFSKVLFEPLMYGVTVLIDRYTPWCPMVYFLQAGHEFIYIDHEFNPVANADFSREYLIRGVSIDSQILLHMGLWALLGLAFLGISLILYRKRRLECAGDFLAHKTTAPVFVVLFTLGVGAFSQGISELFGLDYRYAFLVAGIVLGYFGGMMLLKRSLRVFSFRSLLGFGAMVVFIASSLLCVKFDLFHIVRRVPDASQVVSVNLSPDFYARNMFHTQLTSFQDIENALDIHRYAVENPIPADTETGYGNSSVTNYADAELYYTLANGRTLQRRYKIPTHTPEGQLLHRYYTSVDYVLGVTESQLDSLASSIRNIYAHDLVFRTGDNLTQEQVRHLLKAIALDCKAGNISVEEAYLYAQDAQYLSWLEISDSDGYSTYLSIFDTATNTLSWMLDMGCYITDESGHPLELP